MSVWDFVSDHILLWHVFFSLLTSPSCSTYLELEVLRSCFLHRICCTLSFFPCCHTSFQHLAYLWKIPPPKRNSTSVSILSFLESLLLSHSRGDASTTLSCLGVPASIYLTVEAVPMSLVLYHKLITNMLKCCANAYCTVYAILFSSRPLAIYAFPACMVIMIVK